MAGELSRVWGAGVLLAAVYALVRIAQSDARLLAKAVWMALVLVVPVLGFLLWLAAGPRTRRAP